MPGRPSREFRKLGLRPAPDYFAASKVQAARIAIHSDPVPGRNDLVADLRALGFRINSQRAAADNAGLAHLARDQRSMRGAGADRCHDGSRRSEAGNVGGAGIGSQQDRGFAGGDKALRRLGVERHASGGNPAGGPDAGGGGRLDRLQRCFDQAFGIDAGKSFGMDMKVSLQIQVEALQDKA